MKARTALTLLVIGITAAPLLAWHEPGHAQPLIKIEPPLSLTRSSLPSVKIPKVEIAAPPLLVHPSPMMRVQAAAQAIEKMYRTTATQVHRQLKGDLQKLRQAPAFRWESYEEQQRKLESIRRSEKDLEALNSRARQEATQRAQSWRPSPGWRDRPIRIHKGPALRQLESISVSGW